MRALVDPRPDRLALVPDRHPRFGELEALLARTSLEISRLPTALDRARVVPPPDVIVVPAPRAPEVLPALAEHPVLRWSLTVVTPWAALEDPHDDSLRIDPLLRCVHEGLASRRASCAELAFGKRALFAMPPVGPVPLLLAAARSTGTTIVLEERGARARLTFAHGRFQGGRATDAAQLTTVHGLDALAFAIRLEDAEIMVVRDEEDEPSGPLAEEAVAIAVVRAPRLEVHRPLLRAPSRAPIALAIPEPLEPDFAHEETVPLAHEPAVTRRYPAVARREADEVRAVTRLWHRPIARELEVPRREPTLRSSVGAPLEDAWACVSAIEILIEPPVPDLTEPMPLPSPHGAALAAPVASRAGGWMLPISLFVLASLGIVLATMR